MHLYIGSSFGTPALSNSGDKYVCSTILELSDQRRPIFPFVFHVASQFRNVPVDGTVSTWISFIHVCNVGQNGTRASCWSPPSAELDRLAYIRGRAIAPTWVFTWILKTSTHESNNILCFYSKTPTHPPANVNNPPTHANKRTVIDSNCSSHN